MSPSSTGYYSAELPWTPSREDEQRFRKLLIILALISLVFSIVMPLLPLKEKPKDRVVEVPPRLAKIIEQKKQPSKPPPKVERVESEQATPKPKKKTKPKPKKVTPKKKPDARKQAESSGLLAFKDELAGLRENVSVKKLGGGRLSKGAQKARKSERALITANAGKGSGGINTARLSRDTGGSGLGGRKTTKVSSPMASKGTPAAGSGRNRKGRSGKRDLEKILITFDRNKGAIYRIYNRALRTDPTLHGKVVLSITIAASGRVTACKIVSSELEDGKLERKLVQRVKLINFGAEDVPPFSFTYPIDFFPA